MDHDNIIYFNPDADDDAISDPEILEDMLNIERCLPIDEAEHDADNVVRALLKSFAQTTMVAHYLETLKGRRMKSADRKTAETLRQEAASLQNRLLHLFVTYMFAASGELNPETVEDCPDLQEVRTEAAEATQEMPAFFENLEAFLRSAGSSIEVLETVFNRATDNPEHIGILMTEIACMYDDLCALKNALHDVLSDEEMLEDCTYYDILQLKQSEFDIKLVMEDIMAAIFAGALMSTAKRTEDNVISDYCDHVYELIEAGQDLMESFCDDEDEED